MNSPLLHGACSGDSHLQNEPPPRAFTRRSDAIAYGTSYQKAAALVDLAEDGIGLPEQILEQSRFGRAAKSYFLFIRLDLVWSANLFALMVLNFLEKPLWCAKPATYSCNHRDYYFLGELPYLTGTESLIYEGTTLIILMIHTFFPISYEGVKIFWKNHLNKLKVIFLIIIVADLLVYALYFSPVASHYLPLRIAPYIRVVFFILNIRELRATIRLLAGMFGVYLNILALGLLFLMFSSWLAYVIFEDTMQGKIVFTSYGATLYEMLILFTTSNNPDVWIPAYKVTRWSCLFFVLYVLLGVFFVTNLILAVVYDSFKNQLAKQVYEADATRNRILKKAFDFIDVNKVGFIDKEQCLLLFGELNNYRSLPNISKEEFDLIFNELDDSHDFKINLDEFSDLCNAIALQFQKGDSASCFEKFPSFYNSSISVQIKSFVRSRIFGYVVVFILLLNVVAVVVETTLDIKNKTAQKVWQRVEFVFGWLYVFEMAFKIYALGFANYWRDGQNRFDFIITWIIVIGETTSFWSPHGLAFLSNGEWIRYLIIARVLRLIRLLMHVKRYRAFVATFIALIPSLMPYLGIIFCVLCIYCSIGLHLFGGIVNVGNPKLKQSGLVDDDYLLFNFNDYPNGMVTLFNLLVMGNWHVWMQGYWDLTGSSWTLVYFISFYLITVLLLLNLVMAFVLEAFFAEMELETAENCEEEKEATQKTKPRSVGTKSRSQRVDMLLHHMLSAELESSAPKSSSA